MKKGFIPGLATLLSAAFVFAMPSQASATDVPVLDFDSYDSVTSSGSISTPVVTGNTASVTLSAHKTTIHPIALAKITFTVLQDALATFNWTSSTNKAPTTPLGYTLSFFENGVLANSTTTLGAGTSSPFSVTKGETLGFEIANTGKNNSVATLVLGITPASIRAPEIDGGKLPLAFLLLGMLFVASRRKLFSKTFSA